MSLEQAGTSEGGGASEGDGQSLEERRDRRAAAYERLLRLEDEVHLHRNLLEEEEQVMYVDAIEEMQAVFAQIENARTELDCKLTPWVCSCFPALLLMLS